MKGRRLLRRGDIPGRQVSHHARQRRLGRPCNGPVEPRWVWDASENETTSFVKYQDKTPHRFRVWVSDKVIRCWIDDAKVVAVNVEGAARSTRGSRPTPTSRSASPATRRRGRPSQDRDRAAHARRGRREQQDRLTRGPGLPHPFRSSGIHHRLNVRGIDAARAVQRRARLLIPAGYLIAFLVEVMTYFASGGSGSH